MIQHDLIPNSRFRFMNKPGTGNKSCKVSASEKLRLTNLIVNRKDVDAFLDVLYATGEDRISVEISSRRTSSRWGTAWTTERRCILYRHTVWVYLHELAHVLCIKRDFTGSRIRNNKPHGREFGLHLKCLYEIWMEHFNTGQENKPAKQPANNDLTTPINQIRVPQLRSRLVGGISLQVGDKVWFKTKKLGKLYGIVAKVNRVNCKVKVGLSMWRVSPKLLNKPGMPTGEYSTFN